MPTPAPIALQVPAAVKEAARTAVLGLISELGPAGAAIALAAGGAELDRLLSAVYSGGPVGVTVDTLSIVDARPV